MNESVLWLIPVVATLIGFIYWLQVMFVSKSTCKANHDCIEAEIKSMSDKITTMQSFIETRFTDMEKILNRHD